MLTMLGVEDVPAGLAEKLELMLHPTKNVLVILKTPSIRTYKQLSDYMWPRYHIAVECGGDDDASNIGDLYYSEDGYSWMGYVESLSPNQPILRLVPSNFVGWANDGARTDPDVPFTAEWRRLMSDCQVLGPCRY